MLRAARALGDCLMVGLNGDESVRALKALVDRLMANRIASVSWPNLNTSLMSAYLTS